MFGFEGPKCSKNLLYIVSRFVEHEVKKNMQQNVKLLCKLLLHLTQMYASFEFDTQRKHNVNSKIDYVMSFTFKISFIWCVEGSKLIFIQN